MHQSRPISLRWPALRDQLRWSRLLPEVAAASVISLMIVVLSASFVALIFVEPITSFSGAAIHLMLWTALLAGIGMAIFSSYDGTVAAPQDRVAPIMALMASLIIQHMKVTASLESMAFTVMASIALSAFSVGLAFYFLGTYKLGNIVRFIPYPVIGGFMAGSGWLLVTGSVRVMSGHTLAKWSVTEFFTGGAFFAWLPCALFGIVAYFAARVFRRFLTLPVLIFAGVTLFYLSLNLTHTSLASARAQGWILGSSASGAIENVQPLASLREVDWSALLSQYSSIGAIVLTSIVTLLLNITALELAADEEIDLNRELRAGGLVNLVSGLTGGMVAFQSLSLSSLPIRMGVRSRLVGLFSALFCGALLWLGTGVLGYIPRFILGGILFYNGISFLTEWIYDAYGRLQREDYLLVVFILAIVAMAGYLQGIAAGILIATILFVVKYSSVNVISSRLSGDGHQSMVDRSPAEARVLNTRGGQIHILRLKGFIFFGSANNLLESVRERQRDVQLPKLVYLILDFQHVSGMDTSGLISLSKLARLARKEGFLILATSVPVSLEASFSVSGLLEGPMEVKLYPDRDHALEWCENRILQRELSAEGEPLRTLPQILREAHPWRVDAEGLMNYVERIEVGPGQHLFQQGEPADALFFIESGKVKVMMEIDNLRSVRIRTMGAGTVVGEIGFYLEQVRGASVITEELCQIHRCTLGDLRRMEVNDPALASAFHEFMVRILAERVTQQNRSLRALVD